MRQIFVTLHKWAGLLIAGFLVMSGLTGAVISWDHELDELLNAHLTTARATGPALPSLELARQIEARHPQVTVVAIPMAAEPGHSLVFGVEPRFDPVADRHFEPGFNQVFVDPASGEELGRRAWGSVWPINRENFVSFLYELHYSLHLPTLWGIDRWGTWLMGLIALIWTVDCFTGFYLTLPARRTRSGEVSAPQPGKTWWRRWMPAWKIRRGTGFYKLNFDLHRAFGLWTWALLLVIAFTAFSLNLYREVFFPAMSLVSDVTPTPFEQRLPAPANQPVNPVLSYANALEVSTKEAQHRGWTAPVGKLLYARLFGIYVAQFYTPDDEHGAGGVGHPMLFVDALNGQILGSTEPWKGTAADLFVQAQFPLHSGRILGLPGRILISTMGIVVAALSVTGVVIWLRKRRARGHLPQKTPR
ncbi:PepSY-associated TM helix domain-containing protein [Diaphorobacter aerolatus]|uniref:PepSY domain-containing protein n=1 Tax=Diaphorobacter aerolatus TaxID=1288495 RepID=A0A7H0GIQ4_9BURK|nr:PepSY-associated TM helix domain-containing protein [Diaphorobacter aerolatus]QNP48170.1 PepSY domain-containing protein [Diaphorobacter aerolatus]